MELLIVGGLLCAAAGVALLVGWWISNLVDHIRAMKYQQQLMEWRIARQIRRENNLRLRN